MSNTSENQPFDPTTGLPVGPMEQPGYYPGFKTMRQAKFWDEKTRSVVVDRVENVPPIRFFDEHEARVMKAICDRVLPQDDRDAAHYIPILPQIDKRLAENAHDGYRYESMPPDPEAFRLGIRAIEIIAREAHGASFADVGPRGQDAILKSLHDGEPAAAHDIWEHMPVHRFWMLLVQECAEAYYAHPWAWDEIGFGGPAYPRAYIRLERGEPEPWEVEESRYPWTAPANALSGIFEPIAGMDEHYGGSGQGGTH